METREHKEAVEFADVYEGELDEIVSRRRQAKLSPASNGESARTQVSRDLVALALSGGGVRSASFGLGLIQSFYKKGILRFVDYLSTVSGGGYAGSCLSSMALHPETKFKWNVDNYDDGCDEQEEKNRESSEGEAQNHQESEENFPIAPLADGRQPPRVVELIHSGNALRRPLLFLNRYLIGVVLTNIVLMSVLFMVAALVAFLFRCLDYRGAIDFLYALGFRGDVWRAFFPFYLLFIAWLLMWAISFWRKGSQAAGHFARWFMTLTFVSVLLAFAALLGTGDISLTYWRTELGIDTPDKEIQTVSGELKTALVVLLLIALLPYLRLKDLIRSGTKPKNAVEGWIFAIASRALLFGLPLLVFAYFAHENISLHNEKRLDTKHGVTVSRYYELVPLEFKDWGKTWREIELQASVAQIDQAGEGEASHLFQVSKTIWSEIEKDPEISADLQSTMQIASQISKTDRETAQHNRWLQMFAWFITGQSNEFSRQFDRRKESVMLKHVICNYLTAKVIQNPRFFESFEHVENDFPEMSKEAREKMLGTINAHVMKAKGVLQNESLHADGGMGVSQWLVKREQLLTKLSELEAKGERVAYRETKAELDELISLGNGQFAKLADEVQQANWNLLKTYYGVRLAGKDTVFAMVVVEHDQRTRLAWVGWSALFFLISSVVVSLNATSLHGFYRNRLSKTWITECPAFGRDIPLARLDTTTKGAPYHLLGACLHFLGRRSDNNEPPLVPFLFSRCYCGSDETGYVPTDQYFGGKYDLPNAMAISGAAVTPTQVHNPLLAALLLVANSRLGQWLPNPAHRKLLPSWTDKLLSRLPPSPLRLVIGWLQHPAARNYCFVADGGHTENLGLLELLRRRCKLIIVSDASHDPEYQFQNYVDLHRKVRSELGINLKGIDGGNVNLAQAIPNKETGFAVKHFVVARIIYPPQTKDVKGLGAEEGLLVLLKPNFTGDEPIDLQSYRNHQPLFPHHPTADQFYDPDRFESYRQLGAHIGDQICDELLKAMPQGEKTGNTVAGCQLNGESDSTVSGPSSPANQQWPDKLTEQNLPMIIDALKSDDRQCREHAVHFIAENAPLSENLQQTVVKSLQETLCGCDGDKALCEKVLWVLEELHVPLEQNRHQLLARVQNERAGQKTRLTCLEVLARISPNDEEFVQSLKNLAESKNHAVASRAKTLLKQLKSSKN